MVEGKAPGTYQDLGQYYMGTSYYAAGNLGTTSTYKNQCGTSINTSNNAGALSGYHMLSTYIKTKDSPPQVVGATSFPLNFTMDMYARTYNSYGGVLGTELVTNRRYEAEITVPTGVTYTPGSLAVKNANVSSGYPIFSGNKLTIRFSNVTSATLSPEINAVFTSDGVTACGYLPAIYRATAIWDDTCPNPLISSVVEKDTIQFVCPSSCPTIEPVSNSSRRITMGLVDNNNDGYPDATGTLDLNKIYLNHVRQHDIYRVETK